MTLARPLALALTAARLEPAARRPPVDCGAHLHVTVTGAPCRACTY